MRRVREILRLKHECGATDRAIARSVGIARSTVAMMLDRLAAAELGWPLPAELSDRVLEAMLYAGAGASQGMRRKAEPALIGALIARDSRAGRAKGADHAWKAAVRSRASMALVP
jgi:transposase